MRAWQAVKIRKVQARVVKNCDEESHIEDKGVSPQLV